MSDFGTATLDVRGKSGFRPISQELVPKLTEFWNKLTLENEDGEEEPFNYVLDDTDTHLTIKEFRDGGTKDLVFSRRDGSTKTGIEDIWIPDDRAYKPSYIL
jgi:hypothetical protein